VLEGVAYVELEVDAGGVVGEEVGGTGHGRGWWSGGGLGDIVHPPQFWGGNDRASGHLR
jgi:hypothetical protein